jgi:hypothetical protein
MVAQGQGRTVEVQQLQRDLLASKQQQLEAHKRVQALQQQLDEAAEQLAAAKHDLSLQKVEGKQLQTEVRLSPRILFLLQLHG